MNFSSELLNKGNKTPAFSISIEGRDITTVLDNRLMSLTLTDNRGFEADQLDLELDDADGKIVLPRRGAVITLALGWKGQPLFPKGAFTVDEIEHTGAPDRLTIRARSADFRETLNTWWVRMKTCWYLIALMPTGATPNGQRKCSGNACNAVLRHSRYNWRKGGQISTRKCQ